MLYSHLYLLTVTINDVYINKNAKRFGNAIKEKIDGLGNYIGFIDGTGISMALPTNNATQNVVYNGHKRKHALNVQALTTPDGMFLHCAGTIEEKKHEWKLYVRSGLDEQLENSLFRGKHITVFIQTVATTGVYS